MKMQLSRELSRRYELYAKLMNKNVNDVIQNALADWMDTCGEGDIEVITGVVIDSQAQRMGLAVEHSASMALVN
jgi:hypothetical protein